MNPYNIYLLTNTLIGQTLDVGTFNSLIAIAQMNREVAREWMILKKVNTSQTTSTSDTFLTPKSFPSDFLLWVEKNPIKLVDSVTNPQLIEYFTQVPFEKQIEFKDDFSSFYCDYANNNMYICGSRSQTYFIEQFYIYKPSNVFYDVNYPTGIGGLNQTWAFPSYFASILAYDVAAMNRLGIDYDDLNARMGDSNAQTAETIFSSMVRWDARLAKQSIINMDIFSKDQNPYNQRQVNMND